MALANRYKSRYKAFASRPKNINVFSVMERYKGSPAVRTNSQLVSGQDRSVPGNATGNRDLRGWRDRDVRAAALSRRREVSAASAGTGGALTGQHMNVFEADRLAELEWEVATLRKRLDALDARQRSTETTARILFCALLLATLVITFRLLN